jgi:hypothetical protein
MTAPLDLLEQLQAAHLGHLEVGQDQIGGLLGEHPLGLLAVVRGAYLIANGFEVGREVAADIFFVVDD